MPMGGSAKFKEPLPRKHRHQKHHEKVKNPNANGSIKSNQQITGTKRRRMMGDDLHFEQDQIALSEQYQPHSMTHSIPSLSEHGSQYHHSNFMSSASNFSSTPDRPGQNQEYGREIFDEFDDKSGQFTLEDDYELTHDNQPLNTDADVSSAKK